MAVNDPIGDMIARIRNAAMRGRGKVLTPASKLREHVLDVLLLQLLEAHVRGSHRDHGTRAASGWDERALRIARGCMVAQKETT